MGGRSPKALRSRLGATVYCLLERSEGAYRLKMDDGTLTTIDSPYSRAVEAAETVRRAAGKRLEELRGTSE